MYVVQRSNFFGGWMDMGEFETREDALQALGKVLSRGTLARVVKVLEVKVELVEGEDK